MTVADLPPDVSLGGNYALLSPEGKRSSADWYRRDARAGSIDLQWSLNTVLRIVELRERPFASAIRTLETFRDLPTDWDSYGAAPVSKASISTAMALLSDLSYRPTAYVAPGLLPTAVSPVPTGGVHIQWDRPDGAGMEVWIGSAGSIRILIDRPQSEPRFTTKDVGGLAEAIAEVEGFAA